MTSFDPALGLINAEASYGLDARRGLLYLPERVIPVVHDCEKWSQDGRRPVVALAFGHVPVVPVGSA